MEISNKSLEKKSDRNIAWKGKQIIDLMSWKQKKKQEMSIDKLFQGKEQINSHPRSP